MAALPLILHYLGCDDDRGGIISVVRNLSDTGRFGVVLGVNPGCVQQRSPPLPVLELPRVTTEEISLRNLRRARRVAHAVRDWLRTDAARIYHGHSRAGLLVGWWLHRWGERRIVVSVHCYGRQRWFYRWVARQLGGRLYWLSPAMKQYYRVGGADWTQCIPGCVPESTRRGTRAPPSGTLVRLCGIGLLVRWKNWQLVLAALAQLPPETRRRLRFRHLGTTDGTAESAACAAELRAQSDTSELRGLVEWCGPQPSADPFLAETDCLVVASHHEPLSVAMLEALRAGVPVLAADSGGATDIVVSGRNGWLFRPGDARDLARHFAMLVEGPALGEISPPPESLHRFGAVVVAETWGKIYAGLAKP